jgi:hypothetical protein
VEFLVLLEVDALAKRPEPTTPAGRRPGGDLGDADRKRDAHPVPGLDAEMADRAVDRLRGQTAQRVRDGVITGELARAMSDLPLGRSA